MAGYGWTACYGLLLLATAGYGWLRLAGWLRVATAGYSWLRLATVGYSPPFFDTPSASGGYTAVAFHLSFY
jgi:hypothetical protein